MRNQNYLDEKIRWMQTINPNYPYVAIVDSNEYRIRINDFPDDNLYTLLINNKDVASFDDWPAQWERESETTTAFTEMRSVGRYDWSRLSPLQIEKYAEYLIKMEFTLYGFGVYDSEVDECDIDFVVRKEPDRYYDIQVKFVCESLETVTPQQDVCPRENLFAAFLLFFNSEPPKVFLIRSEAWHKINPLLVDFIYEPRGNVFENWLKVYNRKFQLLREFAFDKIVQRL